MTHRGGETEWSAAGLPEEAPDYPEVQRTIRHLRRSLRRVLLSVALLLVVVIAGVA